MATAKKAATKSASKTARGTSQDRRRVAGGQDYEVAYESKKTGASPTAVKKAVKSVGNSRAKVEGVVRKAAKKS